MKNICVFDINETLLDLSVLYHEFQIYFGDANVGQKWFGQLITSTLVSIVTNSYSNFGRIGVAALDMVAEQHGTIITPEDKKAILSKIKNLPPHPEVSESLARLKKAGFIIVSLTNSTKQVVEAQLTNAKLSKYFDKIFSADTIHRLKPAPEPYVMVGDHFGVKTQNLRIIAAHAWDIAGALNAGCKAAFVARPGRVLDPLVGKPDVIGVDMVEIVDRILQKEAIKN